MNGTEARDLSGHLDDSHCADLVLDLTPDDERTMALAHTVECPECEARLRAHAAAAARARADARAHEPIALPASATRRTGGRGWIATLAAAAALVAVAALPIMSRHRAAPGPGAWLPTVDERVVMREGENEDPHLAAGLAAYRDRDLDLAARELETARASGGAERVRRLYLAHARLASGDVSGALELLRGLDWREIPEPWRRDGVGLLARALRQDGHLAAADSIERSLRTREPASPVVP